jgi:hypothetical protein
LQAFDRAWNPRPTVFVDTAFPAALGGGAQTEVVANVVNAVRTVATDDVSFLWAIPEDMDRSRALDVRVIWSKADVAVTNVTFTGTFGSFATDLALAAAATAFDTVIGAQAGIAVADAVRRGNWGTINGNTLTDAKVWLVINIDTTTLGAGITNADIYGLDLRYWRRMI